MVELQHILVPLDGSQLAEQALPMALSLVQRYSGQLILLSVTDAVVASQFVTHPGALQRMQVVRSETLIATNAYLKEKQKDLQAEGINVKIIATEGDPAESIINTAVTEAVDLIVMSSHGRGGFQRWSFGSVSDKVVRYSHCPVLVVRKGTVADSAT